MLSIDESETDRGRERERTMEKRTRLSVFKFYLVVILIVSIASVGLYIRSLKGYLTKDRYPNRHKLLRGNKEHDFITEDFSIMEGPLTNPNLTAFAKNSRARLVGGKRVFEVGNYVYVRVNLFDGYDKPRIIGGDDVRVRMYNDELKAYASGHVIDHGNGSYTTRLIALWEGKSRIDVTLVYTREAIRALYKIREQILSTRILLGKFKSGKAEEESLCHPFADRLKGKELCNLTLENGGISWYCEKPSNINLLCHDWTEVKTQIPYPPLPITEAEKALISKDGFGISIPDNIEVQVKHQSNTEKNLKSCANMNPALTWNQLSPIGYFHHNRWIPTYCSGFSEPSEVKRCLQGRQLILFGDSTTRHWFEKLKSLLNCTLSTQNWSTAKWHKPAKAANIKLNFSMQWLPHEMPFFVGITWDTRRYTRPISAYLDEIGSDANVVIVVHMYMHLLAYHTNVFQDRIRIIVRSVRHLLQRNPKAKIFVKGSHSFYRTPAGYDRLNDYFGYVFDNILYEEFKDMHDRIIFLKIRDFTNAKKLADNHPSMEDVEQMVKYMLSYLC